MKAIILLLILNTVLCRSQDSPPVEIELMTHAEVYSAIHQEGMTTVIIYNGGTEQRGPHAVLGGHSIMARVIAPAIARKLGNALVAPVLPFSPAGSHLNPKWPGTAGISPSLYSAVNESIVDSMVVNGFKNVVLIGDHGGGQKELEMLAARLEAKYSPATHVYYSGAPYFKVRKDFDEWSKANHLPLSTHAGIPDTSLLMYLGGDKYIRKDKLAAGDPVLTEVQPDSKKIRVNNGVTGDPRPSTPEIGKRLFDMRVAYAVEEIQRLIRSNPLKIFYTNDSKVFVRYSLDCEACLGKIEHDHKTHEQVRIGAWERSDRHQKTAAHRVHAFCETFRAGCNSC